MHFPPYALSPFGQAAHRGAPTYGASAEELGVRNNMAFQNTGKLVEDLRQMSLKAVKNAAELGGKAGAASLQALQAIWELIMSLIRWLARVFQLRSASADKAGKEAKSAENLVDDNAAEVANTLKEAAELSANDAAAFAKTLEQVGLDSSLSKFVQQPGALKDAGAPQTMFLAALTKAEEGLATVTPQFLLVSRERAAAADALSGTFNPPLITEDLVKVCRAGKLSKTPYSPEELAKIDALIAADDKVNAASGQIKHIKESVLVFTTLALNAGVDVGQKGDVLTRIFGAEWRSLVSTTNDEMSSKDAPLAAAAAPAAAPAVVITPELASKVSVEFEGLMTRMLKPAEPGAPEVSPMDGQTAARLASDFMSPGAPAEGSDASPAPLSARERLRLASSQAIQFPMPPAEGYSDDPDLDGHQPKS